MQMIRTQNSCPILCHMFGFETSRNLKDWYLKDYFYLAMTFTLGTCLSIFLFISAMNSEKDRLKREFDEDAGYLTSNFDLLIANQTIRLQNLEEALAFHGPPNPLNHQMIRNMLNKSIFSDFAQFTLKGYDFDRLPIIERTSRVESDKPAAVPGPPVGAPMHSIELRKVMGGILASGSKHKAVFWSGDGKPIFSLVWQSGRNPKIFYIFSAAAKSLMKGHFLAERDFRVIVHQTIDDTYWNFIRIAGKYEVNNLDSVGYINLLRNSQISREYELKVSGEESLRLNVLGTQQTQLRFFWPFVLLGSGFLITLLISFLLFSLINRNIRVSELVRRKTIDLDIERQKAMAAAQAKGRFLANVSHEIRTPLNLILGMSDLAHEMAVSEKQRSYLENLRAAGTHLLCLIEGILEMARVDSEEVELKNEVVDLLPFMEEVCRLVSPACLAKGLQFYFSIDANLPGAIVTDPARLRQVLINLVNNSVKYTDEGHVALAIRMLRAGAANKDIVRAEISVSDTGDGIPEHLHQEIFKAFYQVNSTVTRTRGGVGLGLSIVKAIVTRLGGSVKVSSKPKHGSIFSVQLPLKVQEATSWQAQFVPPAPLCRKVLILSSDANFYRQVMDFTVLHNFELNVISPTPRLFDELQRILDPCQTVIIDARKGASMYHRIAKLVSQQRVVVACTDENFREHFAQIPRVVRLDLPTLPTSFMLAIGYTKISSPQTAVEPSSMPVNTVSSHKALSLVIVDDDPGNRSLIQAYLEGTSWKARFAADGQQALDLCQHEPPDVLIADLQMPVMDGFTLVTKLKEYESEKGNEPTKVIILTADALKETEHEARGHHVDLFLTKPIRKSKLFEAISQVMVSTKIQASALQI
ncbi:MAG: hypothetical protein C5B49_06725 [Bdellovibrio sp.]|nr:MAG: hypothetical protein C5B49_06725 [Bdellovibrio sp.]